MAHAVLHALPPPLTTLEFWRFDGDATGFYSGCVTRQTSPVWRQISDPKGMPQGKTLVPQSIDLARDQHDTISERQVRRTAWRWGQSASNWSPRFPC